MTGKQRAYLRGLANPLPVKYQIGKNGFQDEAFLLQLSEGLEKNELIKIKVLDNSDLAPREVSDTLCRILGCEGVQVIGSKIVLYRESKNNKEIVLPR